MGAVQAQHSHEETLMPDLGMWFPHPTPAAPTQAGAGCSGTESPRRVLLKSLEVLGQNALSKS